MLIGLAISSFGFSCLLRLLWHNEMVMRWSCFSLWYLQTRIILVKLFGREDTLLLCAQIFFVDSILTLIMMGVVTAERLFIILVL